MAQYSTSLVKVKHYGSVRGQNLPSAQPGVDYVLPSSFTRVTDIYTMLEFIISLLSAVEMQMGPLASITPVIYHSLV